VKVTALRNPCEQIKPPTRAAQAGPQPRRGRAPGPQGQDQGIVLRGGLVRPGDAIRRPQTSIPSRLGSPTLKTARSWCAATGSATTCHRAWAGVPAGSTRSRTSSSGPRLTSCRGLPVQLIRARTVW